MRAASCIALLCAMALAGVSTSRGAVVTTVNAPIATGEEGHPKILSTIYGGTFVALGSSYTNGGTTALRVDDAIDQIWNENFQVATAKTIFANFNQEFGYMDGASGGTYHVLLTETGGKKYLASPPVSLASVNGKTIRWARDGDGELFTSLPGNNSDGKDHMVTYEIQGLQDGQRTKTWLLFWEDLPKSAPHPDFDYNDLVVEIKATLVTVPEPTVLAPLAGMLLLGARRRMR